MAHNRQDRREFLGALAATLALGGCVSLPSKPKVAAPPPKPPNIIFMLVDDMGYADLGCFGSTLHETPNLDRLAAAGVRFTQAYAACPVCSPTRASIMTGKYPARLKLTDFLKGDRSPRDSPLLPAVYADELPLEEVTVAEVLRQAGYFTGHIGKWHLGKKGFWPGDQGFDFNYAGCQSGMPKSHFWPDWEGNPPVQGTFDGEYLADRLTDEACRFIETHQKGPFFLNFCHYSVHLPLQAKADKIAKYEAKLASHPALPGHQNNPVYAAMVELVDDSAGRVLEMLERCGIENDTIFIFFSDNGGLAVKELNFPQATSNAPLRDGKGYLHEGGIREPMIVCRPGGIAPGTVCDEPVCSIDFLPTVAALAGISPADAGAVHLDGVDISPLFDNPSAHLGRDALYWHYPHFSNQGGRPGGAVRVGDWKLIENFEFGDLELYNLKEDIGETRNRAPDQPERARRMLEMLVGWRKRIDANMPRPNPEYVSGK